MHPSASIKAYRGQQMTVRVLIMVVQTRRRQSDDGGVSTLNPRRAVPRHADESASGSAVPHCFQAGAMVCIQAAKLKAQRWVEGNAPRSRWHRRRRWRQHLAPRVAFSYSGFAGLDISASRDEPALIATHSDSFRAACCTLQPVSLLSSAQSPSIQQASPSGSPAGTALSR